LSKRKEAAIEVNPSLNMGGTFIPEKPRCNFLVVGAIGDGKSCLVKTLLPDDYQDEPPLSAVAARGVTKTCSYYPVKDTNCFLIDTPGIGDADCGLGDVIPMIEQFFKMEDDQKELFISYNNSTR